MRRETFAVEVEGTESLTQYVEETLSFPRALLELLQNTRLFGPLVERAISDIDSVIEKFRKN